MLATPSNIIDLRAFLAVKFPAQAFKPASQRLGTGLSSADDALDGGLPRGALTEIVCPGQGGGLVLSALLRATLQRRGLMALIDGADSFDPADVPAAALTRCLWVRGKSAARAVQAADLLLRDGNLGLIALDLRSNSDRETGRVPMSSWHRLQRVVEPTATSFVVLTRQAIVSAARPRLTLQGRFTLADFERPQSELAARFVAVIEREERTWKTA